MSHFFKGIQLIVVTLFLVSVPPPGLFIPTCASCGFCALPDAIICLHCSGVNKGVVV